MLFVFLTAHKGDDDDDYGNFANFVDLKKKKQQYFSRLVAGVLCFLSYLWIMLTKKQISNIFYDFIFILPKYLAQKSEQ